MHLSVEQTLTFLDTHRGVDDPEMHNKFAFTLDGKVLKSCWLLGRRGKVFLSSSMNGGQMASAALNRQTQEAHIGISHSNMFGDKVIGSSFVGTPRDFFAFLL